jgi:hypothetical protein
MRKIIATLYFCIYLAFGYAQPGKKGMPGGEPYTFESSQVLEVPGGGFVGLRTIQKGRAMTTYSSRWNEYVLYRYNSNMVKEKEVEFGSKKEFGAYYSEFFVFGGKLWLVNLLPVDDFKGGSLVAIEINPQTLELSEPRVLISAEEHQLKSGAVGARGYTFNVHSSISPDRQRISFMIINHKSKFSIGVFDGGLERKWYQNPELDKLDRNWMQSLVVNNAGEVALGYTHRNDGYVTILKEKPNPTWCDMPVKDMGVNMVGLLVDEAGSKIHITGGYVDGSYNCVGIYQGSINMQTGTMDPFTKHKFPERLVEQLADDDLASTKDRKYGVNRFWGTQFFYTADKVPDLLIEFNEGATPSANSRTPAMVHSRNLLNVRFASDGLVFTRVPKYTIFTMGDFSRGYHLQIEADRLLVLYYDSEDNLKQDVTSQKAKYVRIDKTRLVAALIGYDGSLTRQPIYSEPYTSRRTRAEQVSMSSYQIPVCNYGVEACFPVKR